MNLRDFVEVGVDPSRPDMSSALQLKTSLNIPPLQAEEHCDNIDMNEIFFVDAGNVVEEQQTELSIDNYFAPFPEKKKRPAYKQKNEIEMTTLKWREE
jgi:hypothetical protein